MSDQQALVQPTDGDQDEIDHPALRSFGRKSSFGVYQFLFEFWQAWMIIPEQKRLAPLCRIILGDEDDGSVLLDKTVIVTGLLHLADDITRAVAFNIHRASELPGFALDVPGGESHVIELIDGLEESLKEIRAIIESNKIFAPVNDEDGDDEHKK
jgi:hypothetical protein